MATGKPTYFRSAKTHQSSSTLMQNIYARIFEIALSNKHVVLVGEIGTGKTMIARLIHGISSMKEGPFQTFYCLDIDENEYKDAFWEQLRIENEHITLKYELLEKTSSGTLFLDQFSELQSGFMLNIIESYVIGCRQLFRYNMAVRPRLIISINQERYLQIKSTDEWDQVLQLINPVIIMIPPLRERREDIAMLINEFISDIRKKGPEWKQLDISEDAMAECRKYNWPGNIRQLKNAIVQGAILSHGKRIESAHLPFTMKWKLPYQLGKE